MECHLLTIPAPPEILVTVIPTHRPLGTFKRQILAVAEEKQQIPPHIARASELDAGHDRVSLERTDNVSELSHTVAHVGCAHQGWHQDEHSEVAFWLSYLLISVLDTKKCF